MPAGLANLLLKDTAASSAKASAGSTTHILTVLVSNNGTTPSVQKNIVSIYEQMGKTMTYSAAL
jgi:hypothetical protein